MLEFLPAGLKQVAVGWVGGFAAAIIGRITALLVHKPYEGRSAFGWHLLWELPLVFFSVLIGAGLSQWLGYQGTKVELAIIATCAYVGPREAEHMLVRYLKAGRKR